MIRLVEKEDRQALEEFFKLMIYDTYHREGLGHLEEAISEEIASKMQCFEESLLKLQSLYVLMEDQKIIGSAAWSPCSLLIKEMAGELGELNELSSVFIHKDYQEKGNGNRLLKYLFQNLRDSGHSSFVLDSGYKNASKVWRHKFGEPYRIIKDYWSVGFDHNIWLVVMT